MEGQFVCLPARASPTKNDCTALTSRLHKPPNQNPLGLVRAKWARMVLQTHRAAAVRNEQMYTSYVISWSPRFSQLIQTNRISSHSQEGDTTICTGGSVPFLGILGFRCRDS
jgi:hypothetical protein